jgi:hypothetical protein
MRRHPSSELLGADDCLTTDAGNGAALRLLLSISSKPQSSETLTPSRKAYDSPGLAVFLVMLDDKQLFLLQRFQFDASSKARLVLSDNLV